jgi:hypothetical protein
VVEQLAAATAVAGHEALDRAVGLPATVPGHLDRAEGRARVQRAAERQAHAPAPAGLHLQRARALGDRQQDPLGVAGRLTLEHAFTRAAGEALHVASHVVHGGGALGVEADQAAEVIARREQQRLGWLAVASGPACFLVIGLQARWDCPVRDRADVGLVDAHAERVGGHDHRRAAVHERGLACAPRLRGHAGVVGQRGDALSGDEGGHRLGVPARPAVDDRGQAVALAESVQQRSALAPHRSLALHRHHVEGNVGTIEPRSHHDRVAQSEALGDLGGHPRRGGRGGGHHRRTVEVGDRAMQAQIVGAEVMAPLGHAVRLVDDEQDDATRGQRSAKAGRGKALGRREHEPGPPGADVAQGIDVVPVRHARREHHGPNALGLHAAQLIGHQRDQRADDDDQAASGQRRQLVAQRLAPAGGHDHEAVASGQRRLDAFALAGPERGEAEAGQQLLGRGRRAGRLGIGGGGSDAGEQLVGIGARVGLLPGLGKLAGLAGRGRGRRGLEQLTQRDRLGRQRKAGGPPERRPQLARLREGTACPRLREAVGSVAREGAVGVDEHPPDCVVGCPADRLHARQRSRRSGGHDRAARVPSAMRGGCARPLVPRVPARASRPGGGPARPRATADHLVRPAPARSARCA